MKNFMWSWPRQQRSGARLAKRPRRLRKFSIHTSKKRMKFLFVGVARELAEGKTSPDFPKALELHDRFKAEYGKMLQEHLEIVKTLDVLKKVAKSHKKRSVEAFVTKLKHHAKTEEDLTYPAVLMIGKLLRHL